MTDVKVTKFGWMKRLAYAACALFAATAMSGCDPEFADSLAESLATQTPTVLSETERGKIVYERNRGVWIVNADGTGAKEVVAFGDQPDLSQDGTRIVFRRGSSELWTTPLKSPAPVKLFTSQGFVFSPVWSPNGRLVAYVENRGTKQIYAIRADAATTGATPEKVTGVKNFPETGRFFADNQAPRSSRVNRAQQIQQRQVRLASNSSRPAPRRESTIGLQEFILNASVANNFDPAFSPDGKFIVFVSDRGTIRHTAGAHLGNFNNNELYKIRLSDQTETRLTDKARETADPRLLPYAVPTRLAAPSYSPDGRAIVFASVVASNSTAGGTFRIVADARGSENRGVNARDFIRLSERPGDAHPVFSPNGTRIAFERGGTIYTRPNSNQREDDVDLKSVTAGKYPAWGKVKETRFGYGVTGRVKTSDGTPIPGASIALTGGIAGKLAQSSSSGFYSFAGVPSGSYTLTVSAPGFGFSQPSQTVVINEAPDTGNDFIGAAKTFVVQGFIRDVNNRTVDGLNVTLRNNASPLAEAPQRTTSARGGFYQFERVAPGTYTLSVATTQYTFTPSTRTVNVVNDDVKNQDFKATAQKFSISGAVIGATDSNFIISGGPTGATFFVSRTASGYNYTIGDITPGTYTLRPTSTKYDFAPATLSVTVSSANVTGKNFTATLKASKFSISGTISGIAGNDFGDTAIAVLRGTTFVLRTPVTSANYVIPDLAPGSYTLAPVSSKYNFTPDTLAVTVAAANVTDKNFTASLKPAVTTVTLQPISGLTASVVKRSRTGADINPGLFIAGDHDLDGDNDGRPDGVIQGFVSYDTSAIPANATIQSATFSAGQNPSLFEGDPYGAADSNQSLGNVFLERARYDSINGSGQTPLSLSSLNEGALLPNDGTPPNTGARLLSTDGRAAVKTADVTAIVQLRVAAGSGLTQFRLRFARNSNANNKVDFADFTPGTLVVKYSGGTVIDRTPPTVAVTSPKDGEPVDARTNLLLEVNGVAGTASDNVGVVRINVTLQRNAPNATFPDGFYNWKTKVFDNQFNNDSITPARSTDGFRTWKAANTDAARFPNLEVGRTYSVNAQAIDAAANSTTRGSQFVRGNVSNSAVLATITLGGVPEQIAVNEKTNRIYVAREGGVDVINGDTNAIIARVALSNFPRSIAVNTATNKIYVGGFSNVSVIDGATNTVLSILQQSSVLGVAVNPDPDRNPATNDSRIYTTQGGNVNVFSGADETLITQIPVGNAATGREPYGIDVNTANNKVYVAIFGNEFSGATTGGVAVINGATNTVIKTLTTDRNTVDVAVNPATNKIYVTSRSARGVRVINGATDALAGEVNLGLATENAAVNPATNRIYVSTAARVVNGQNNTFLGFYNLGGGESRFNTDGVAVNFRTNRIYFGNSDSTLSVVDGSVAPAAPGSTPN